MKQEKGSRQSGGIYHKIQVELTYNSNHMEGSRLTYDQTRYIYETNTIGVSAGAVNVDDILETANHFRCVDLVIEHARLPLSEKFIKELHAVLKAGTSDSRLDWFAVGGYKKMPNEVGGMETAAPAENVSDHRTHHRHSRNTWSTDRPRGLQMKWNPTETSGNKRK